MLQKPLISIFLVSFSIISFAQGKTITLNDIWNGSFRTERIEVLHSMKNGRQYSVLNFNRSTRSTSVDLYDYKTQSKVMALVDSKDLQEVPYFTNYIFSSDESKIILATEVESIYRRSTLGVFFVYDIASKKLQKISDSKIQEPTLSPDGSQVAYVFNNNLYLKNLKSNSKKQITFDGQKNKIINGITDWVYEEEFAFVRAYEWNSDGNKIAFLRFDETSVPEFSMDVYGQDLYQTQQVFKYPKAGEKNAIVSLHVYHIDKDLVNEVKLDKFYNDYYIPRIKWTSDASILSAQYINRHQNELDLWAIDTSLLTETSNASSIILTETDAAYVDITDNLTFLKDNSFIWTSERNGYNHLYHYNKKGKLIKQLTKGNWEVTEYYGCDEKNKRIYYQSVENGSINRDIYVVDLDGKNKSRLSTTTGTNAAAFSADFTYYINTFSSATNPPIYTLNRSSDGQVLKTIKTNDILLKKLADYAISNKVFSTLSVNGNDLNMWTIKPKGFDPNKSYPMLMYQYSGPGSQEVANRWNDSNDYWHQMLSQQGYYVVCIDGRGTGFKGSDFKKVTYMNLVKYETEDQIAAAEKLSKLPYIDKSRIGIWGWSFGGQMSTNCLLKGSSIFKMAIAVAPVTNWRFYDTIYTERYMRTPQENAAGYDDNSPFNYPEKLEGDYLLVHGSGDDNVHLQNTMRMVEALVQADKQFEWAIYPDKNHGIYGGNTRLHLYSKMTNFLSKTLGDKILSKQN